MKKEESMLVKGMEWGFAVLGILFMMEVTADLWLFNKNLGIRCALNRELLANAERVMKSGDTAYAPGVYYEPLISTERKEEKNSLSFFSATRLRIKVTYPKGGAEALKRVVLSLEDPKLAAEIMPKAVTFYLCGHKNLSEAGSQIRD